ncbi:MAG: response regulator [Clostridia bacterium]|nr:response regulator [Deltaproteobacteria bacterium]
MTEAIKGRLLCIDDDARMRRAVMNTLVPLGVEVVEASGVGDALEVATRGTFDMVICDYVLEDTDGIELIAKIKERQPAAVYALMTGVSDINLLIGAVNSRAISYVVLKPWHAEEIREIVRTALTKSMPAAAPPPTPPPVAKADTSTRAPKLAFAATVGLLAASVIAFVMGQREAGRDAIFLAQRVADVALASPNVALGQLAGNGITYVAVSNVNGDLVAYSVDRNTAQVAGTDKDAALALREVGPNDRMFVAKSRNETMIAEVGVASDAFASSVRDLRYLFIAAAVLTALAGSAALTIR